MSQGNPDKVNAIVDEIVKNNNLFKLKSPIEQDKEKDSIAKSINSAISVLNEVGKELVLQELSVDPDEKFKGFIDSVGNVDIFGLTQMTATIVKAKIEEAEREGINLRQGSPAFKDTNKTLLVGGVLTVAVIDTMIREYDNLSEKDKFNLLDFYQDMSVEQRQKFNINFDKEQDDMFSKLSPEKQEKSKKIKKIILNKRKLRDIALELEMLIDKKTLTDDDKKRIKDIADILNNNGYDKLDKKSLIRIQNALNKDNKALELETKIRNGYELEEEEHHFLERYKEQNPKFEEEFDELYSDNPSKKINSREKHQEIIEKSDIFKYFNDEFELVTLRNMESFIPTRFDAEIGIINLPNNDTYLKIDIFNQIEQLPSALVKASFSQEDILEAMKQYRDYISNYSEISEVVADNIKKLDSDDIVLNIQDDFNSLNGDGQINSNVHKILNILAQVNYGSSMQQILTNLEVREQFLAQFDKVIEQGINLEQDVKLDGELAQIFSQYFKDNAEEMDISAIEEQKEQVTDEQVKQEDPKEMYSFIDSEYLKQDSIEGLIPRNGENSQSLQDDKKAIFYSHGKEGAIVMYFEFLKQYERLRGSAGDKALEQYANYKNGTIELSDEQVQLLQGQLKQITQMRETKDFDEFMGDKLYLKLNGIDIEQDRQAAEEWRASHPGTRMDYNYANSWTNSAISPDRIDVVSLQSKDGKDVRTSQKDLIKYFLSQTSIDKIEELGVNDTTLENIRKYYQEHSAEIAQMGEEYSVVTQNIQEFEQSRESKEAEKQSETRETEITAPEIEKHEENLPAKQDNSFLGKIKRVFANMKDMKNKDNSKGFFARLGASIQTVFGNKKDEFDEKQDENITLNSTQRKEQTREDSKQTNYLTQHFDVNEKQAVQDLKKKQDSKDKDSQLSQDDQEFGNL